MIRWIRNRTIVRVWADETWRFRLSLAALLVGCGTAGVISGYLFGQLLK